MIADAVQRGDRADVRSAVALYGAGGVVLCVSWFAFYHFLSRHLELIEPDVAETFFPKERTRALIGCVLYAAAGAVGYLAAPQLGLGIFFALPIFYGVTSEGLYDLPGAIRGA